MGDLARRWVDGALTAILLFLILSQADGFSKVVSSGGTTFVQSVYALSGRNAFGNVAR